MRSSVFDDLATSPNPWPYPDLDPDQQFDIARAAIRFFKSHNLDLILVAGEWHMRRSDRERPLEKWEVARMVQGFADYLEAGFTERHTWPIADCNISPEPRKIYDLLPEAFARELRS